MLTLPHWQHVEERLKPSIWVTWTKPGQTFKVFLLQFLGSVFAQGTPQLTKQHFAPAEAVGAREQTFHIIPARLLSLFCCSVVKEETK